MNRVEKGVGIGIVAAIVLAFGGWYLWKMNHHAATAVTQSASVHTISEPLAPDGNPVLFDGDSPARQQYLATLETQVTPASSATSNVAAVGIIAAVKGNTITLEQFEPQLSSPSGDIGIPTIVPAAGVSSGTLQVVVNSDAHFVGTAPSSLRAGQTVAVGGAVQQGTLHADIVSNLQPASAKSSASAQTAPPVATSEPSSPAASAVPHSTAARATLADFSVPPSPQQSLDDAQTSLFMSGSANKSAGQFNYSGRITLANQGSTCLVTAEPQVIADNHMQWSWPFDLSAPDRQHLLATALGRSSDVATLNILPGLNVTTEPNQTNRYSIYSGLGGVIGVDFSLDCTILGKEHKDNIQVIKTSFAMVNAAYTKAPLPGNKPLSVPSLSCMGWSFGLGKVGIKEKESFEGADDAKVWGASLDADLKLCLDESVAPAPLHATATAGNATQAIDFGTKPVALGNGFAGATSVRLSGFSYTPVITSDMHAELKLPLRPEINKVIATLKRPLPSQPTPSQVDVTLVPSGISLRGGANVDFQNPKVKNCTIESGVLAVRMYAYYNNNEYGFLFEGPSTVTSGQLSIVPTGPASQTGVAFGAMIDPFNRPSRIGESTLARDWDIVSSGGGGTLNLQPSGSGVSGSFQTAVSILNALPGIAVDSSKPITASGSWFCPSTHYSASG